MTKSLTLGLILDCDDLAEQGSHELIEWLELNPDVTLKKYLLKNSSPRRNYLASSLWSLIIYLESLFYRRYFSNYLEKPINFEDFFMLDVEVLCSSNFIYSSQFKSLQSDQIDLFLLLNFDEKMQDLCNAS